MLALTFGRVRLEAAIENVNQNGSLVHKILPSNESQVRPLTELSDAAAVVRMLASGGVTGFVTL